MLRDAQGLEVTTNSPEAIAAINHFLSQSLSYGNDAQGILKHHYFYLGNKEDLLLLAEKVLPANRENHYLYGMIAFGLEQCHRLEEAEVAGRRAGRPLPCKTTSW